MITEEKLQIDEELLAELRCTMCWIIRRFTSNTRSVGFLLYINPAVQEHIDDEGLTGSAEAVDTMAVSRKEWLTEVGRYARTGYGSRRRSANGNVEPTA